MQLLSRSNPLQKNKLVLLVLRDVVVFLADLQLDVAGSFLWVSRSLRQQLLSVALSVLISMLIIKVALKNFPFLIFRIFTLCIGHIGPHLSLKFLDLIETGLLRLIIRFDRQLLVLFVLFFLFAYQFLLPCLLGFQFVFQFLSLLETLLISFLGVENLGSPSFCEFD